MGKRWRIADPISDDFVKKFPAEERIVLQLLYNRGLTDPPAIANFLNPDYDQQILDPFLFTDMAKAADRILRAADDQETVLVYGDYDADGVCSAAIVYLALRQLGIAATVRIPSREVEGYGLNQTAAEEIAAAGYKLVVTVDCGISNQAEVAYLADNGVDVIVTDHHQEPPELPVAALAIINPSLTNSPYPFRQLCGAGVAFKLVQGLIRRQGEREPAKSFPAGFDKWLLDLAAVATIGDIMPLLGENRVLVKYGLIVMARARRLGFRKIMEKSNSQRLDANYIGWRVVPRLNAAGRINHASLAFELLTAENEETADKLVNSLEEENSKRQTITVGILKEAESQVGEPSDQKIIWAVGAGWHQGVVGLVAGRLSDKYRLPALVIAQAGDKYVGSGRSIEEFDITAGLSQCREYLVKFGGHRQACGFTVSGAANLAKFKEKLSALATQALADLDLRPALAIEAEVKLAEINWELWDKIEQFAPFGAGNPAPLFALTNLRVEQVQTVGADGKHLRAMVSQANHQQIHKLIGFSFGEWRAKLNIGDKIDIVFELGVNEWNGNRELQLKVVDLRLSNN